MLALLNFKELIDVIELRRPLIKIAGRLAAERATKDEIEKMKNFLNKFKDNLSEKELIKLDSKFHDLINMATHNQVLYGVLQALRDRVLTAKGQIIRAYLQRELPEINLCY